MCYYIVVNEGDSTIIKTFTQLDKIYKNKAFSSLSALQEGLINGHIFSYNRCSEFSNIQEIYLPGIKQIAKEIFERYTFKYQNNKCFIGLTVDYIKESLGFQTQPSRVKEVYNQILYFEGKEQSSSSRFADTSKGFQKAGQALNDRMKKDA